MPKSSGPGSPLRKWAPHASSQCCRWPGRASERPPPRKRPKNRFFPCFVALRPAEGISRAQQKHIEGSGTLKRGGRPTEARRTPGPEEFSKIMRGSVSPWTWPRAGWWEGADLGVAHGRGEGRYRLEGGKISFLRKREMQEAWSSISELLWHGNEGGWGDAFV